MVSQQLRHVGLCTHVILSTAHSDAGRLARAALGGCRPRAPVMTTLCKRACVQHGPDPLRACPFHDANHPDAGMLRERLYMGAVPTPLTLG